MLRFSILSDDDGRSYVTLVHGGLYTADSDHPNYDRIVERLVAQDESVIDLFDVAKAVEQRFNKVSERVSVSSGRVFFDGDEVNNALTKHIVRVLEDGGDFTPLVNFFENIEQNPNENSRENLFRWLSAQDFTITNDGDIVGYKGVSRVYTEDGSESFESLHSGPAIVDGLAVNGKVPNNPGSVVEMPRSDVAFNPGVACSTGLHVGTWDYASSFAGVVLEVHVNPRDVVSVPEDHGDSKMRTCRYKVVGVVSGKYDETVLDYDEDEDDDESLWGGY